MLDLLIHELVPIIKQLAPLIIIRCKSSYTEIHLPGIA